MQCTFCGAELPNEAAYCWKCGKPQQASSETTEDYEIAVVDCTLVSDAQHFSSWFQSHDWYHGARLKFIAQAVGPHGNYVTAESPVFKAPAEFPPADDDPHTREVYHRFIMDLVDQGWELLGTHGGEWYSQKLRRRLDC
jgi:hypothetical protein